jgi:thymidylate synthase
VAMRTFSASTANGVWRQAHEAVAASAVEKSQPSRAGDTLELLQVALHVENPLQRWVISRRPAMNPAFIIAEVLWILAGKNDAGVMNYWFPKLPAFAGVGETYAGAYGYRLRQHFGIDQVARACDALSSDPKSRQVVLQIWDARTDLPSASGAPASADVPCNVVSMLKVRHGRLEWTQVMRSNDLYRGLPNNFVQFTVLQEVMSGWLGIEVGGYHHWSDSLHIYVDAAEQFSCGPSLNEETNADSLAVSLDAGRSLIAEMYRRMTLFTSSELTEGDLAALVALPEAPAGYQNLLRVLGAESARRRARSDQAVAIMARCTNPQLVQVWSAWRERVSARGPNTADPDR